MKPRDVLPGTIFVATVVVVLVIIASPSLHRKPVYVVRADEWELEDGLTKATEVQYRQWGENTVAYRLETTDLGGEPLTMVVVLGYKRSEPYWTEHEYLGIDVVAIPMDERVQIAEVLRDGLDFKGRIHFYHSQ
ncbi:hypothetical protein MYX07_02025 [Patescibacteria group bacterium AH-259-L07]|nr:hypothetical protein [Patescibacteria group bacterium AH-259-L07]